MASTNPLASASTAARLPYSARAMTQMPAMVPSDSSHCTITVSPEVGSSRCSCASIIEVPGGYSESPMFSGMPATRLSALAT